MVSTASCSTSSAARPIRRPPHRAAAGMDGAGAGRAGDRGARCRAQRGPAAAADARRRGSRCAEIYRCHGQRDPRHVCSQARGIGALKWRAQRAERQPTEEELRAAYEAEIKKIRVEHVLLEHVVTMVNLGMRRTGRRRALKTSVIPSRSSIAIEAIRRPCRWSSRAAPAAGRARSARRCRSCSWRS